MSCERPPEIGELLDKLVVVRQFLLEVRIRVDVDDYCEPLIQNHLDRGIQISQVVLGNSVCLFAAEHWLWIDAQPDMIELHRLDQGDVLRRGPRFKVLLGVGLLVIHLREPFAQVDAVAQMCAAFLCQPGILGSLRESRDCRAGKRQNERHGNTTCAYIQLLGRLSHDSSTCVSRFQSPRRKAYTARGKQARSWPWEGGCDPALLSGATQVEIQRNPPAR